MVMVRWACENMMSMQSTQLEALVAQIVGIAHPLRVILFGSIARNQTADGSDVDLLIVMPAGTHRRQTAQTLYRQIHDIPLAVDLLVVTDQDLQQHADNPGLIYQTILREGRILYAA
ncbi:MAG: nucleotidyltransferase domain-containing protein [Phycisphaeraceae bacterium]|nr:nucleotidyltransferase domain-containing protein [Phycisphaeraceae bacterium]